VIFRKPVFFQYKSQYHVVEDTFFSRDMVKKQKRMMYGEMKKNHNK